MSLSPSLPIKSSSYCRKVDIGVKYSFQFQTKKISPYWSILRSLKERIFKFFCIVIRTLWSLLLKQKESVSQSVRNETQHSERETSLLKTHLTFWNVNPSEIGPNGAFQNPATILVEYFWGRLRWTIEFSCVKYYGQI